MRSAGNTTCRGLAGVAAGVELAPHVVPAELTEGVDYLGIPE
jgi:hypothetical protein